MKILGLDLGDKWIGSAISDALGISCKPFKTVTINELDGFLTNTLEQEEIELVIVGYPQTNRGTESDQTKKVAAHFQTLSTKFSFINGQKIEWKLWDERLSSKRAQQLMTLQKKGKDVSQKEHSLAAAFILQNYLDSKAFMSHEPHE